MAQPELALLLPFASSADEVELAVRLGVPLYGADPELDWLGTKTGSRRVFAEGGCLMRAASTSCVSGTC